MSSTADLWKYLEKFDGYWEECGRCEGFCCEPGTDEPCEACAGTGLL